MGVRGGLTDVFNIMHSGVFDTALFWPEAAKTFAIAKVAPYVLRANPGAVTSKTLTVDTRFWDGLDADVQGVLRWIEILYRDRLPEGAMARAATSEAAFVETGGTIINLADEKRVVWAASMPNIARQWAAGLEADGKDGSGMLGAYINKLIAGGETPARNWAEEA